MFTDSSFRQSSKAYSSAETQLKKETVSKLEHDWKQSFPIELAESNSM